MILVSASENAFARTISVSNAEEETVEGKEWLKDLCSDILKDAKEVKKNSQNQRQRSKHSKETQADKKECSWVI